MIYHLMKNIFEYNSCYTFTCVTSRVRSSGTVNNDLSEAAEKLNTGKKWVEMLEHKQIFFFFRQKERHN